MIQHINISIASIMLRRCCDACMICAADNILPYFAGCAMGGWEFVVPSQGQESGVIFLRACRRRRGRRSVLSFAFSAPGGEDTAESADSVRRIVRVWVTLMPILWVGLVGENSLCKDIELPVWVFGNRRGESRSGGGFRAPARKPPPHLPPTTGTPREPPVLQTFLF